MTQTKLFDIDAFLRLEHVSYKRNTENIKYILINLLVNANL